MLNNNIYNLMMRLTEEHKSLWRIKKDYMRDASKTKDVKDFWTKVSKEKENHIKELAALIKKHM